MPCGPRGVIRQSRTRWKINIIEHAYLQLRVENCPYLLVRSTNMSILVKKLVHQFVHRLAILNYR